MFRSFGVLPISFSDPIPTSVDVLIIGGGVIGITTARDLTKRGLSVLVCDKGRIAGEQSSRNWGWVRSMGRDPDEVPIAMAANIAWQELQHELGDGIGFRPAGIAALASTAAEMAEFQDWTDNVATQHGLDTRMLSAEAACAMVGAKSGRWLGGMYTPSDGRAEPFTAVKTIATSIHGAGCFIRENCAVRVVETEGGRVSRVVTEAGTVKVNAVLCAAGAWSSLFLSNMGVRLPQLAVKGTVARTVPVDSFFEGAGSFGDVCIRRREDGGYTVATGFCQHYIGANSFRFLREFIPSLPSASELSLAVGSDATQRGFFPRRWGPNAISPFEKLRINDPAASSRALSEFRQRLIANIPQLADVEFAEVWAGMIDATPDVVPVMDSLSSIPGMYVATGFSGHGFGIGPAAGKIMASLIVGEDVIFDLSRFRFSRFSDGSKLRAGPGV